MNKFPHILICIILFTLFLQLLGDTNLRNPCGTGIPCYLPGITDGLKTIWWSRKTIFLYYLTLFQVEDPLLNQDLVHGLLSSLLTVKEI